MLAPRTTVDLDAYPDLVVVYLGMRANTLRGLVRLLRVGPQIDAAVAAGPDGLLRHERILFGLFPLHVGMRQYWRDPEALERFTRAEPHRTWWSAFGKDPRHNGLWHEASYRRGGMEALYTSMPNVGLASFAPTVPATGRMFSARQRAGLPGQAAAPVVAEADVA